MNTKLIAALALTAAVGAAQAAKIPSDLIFDGYCDGMTGLTKNANGSGAGGTWANLDCAGSSALLAGVQGKAAGGKGYILGSTGVAGLLGVEVTWVVNSDKTWYIYYYDGSILNLGTWSPGTPFAHTGKASTAK
jgi:hypothetical protein